MANRPVPSQRQPKDPENLPDASAIDEAIAEGVRGDEPQFDPSVQGNRTSDSSAQDLRAELAEAHKRTLQAQADLDNFRKRTRREQSEQLRFAMLPLIRDLLPVIDNFRRAIHSTQADPANASVMEGITMVERLLTDVLRQHGCEEVGAAGEEFDPNRHEAVGHQHSAEMPAGRVLDVLQAGYRLHDRIVRAPHVIVSKGPP